MRRDIEKVRGQVEFVVQRVTSELLLFKDAESQQCVKRLLSLWTDCTSTMLAKGNSLIKELVNLHLKLP